MSNGPHRSLNMRRGWRQFAERAGNAAFTDGEHSDALAVALECDWSEEVRSRMEA